MSEGERFYTDAEGMRLIMENLDCEAPACGNAATRTEAGSAGSK